MNRVKKKKMTGRMRSCYIALVFFFLYLPIGLVIVYSFNTSKMNILFEGFTVHWYADMLQNRPLMEALKNTLIIAVLSTAVSTVIGTLGAVGLGKYDFAGKKLLNKLLYIPVVIPEIVLGIALLCIYSAIRMTLGIITITLAHITFCIPFVIISVRARLIGMDKSLEEASMDLGANRAKTFVNIMLPLLMPGIFSGAVLSFCLSLDDIIISFFTSGPTSTTLPMKVFSMVKTGVTPEVNALFTVIMLCTIGMIAVNTGVQLRKMKSKKQGKRHA